MTLTVVHSVIEFELGKYVIVLNFTYAIFFLHNYPLQELFQDFKFSCQVKEFIS